MEKLKNEPGPEKPESKESAEKEQKLKNSRLFCGRGLMMGR
jgi:hypothetical protein